MNIFTNMRDLRRARAKTREPAAPTEQQIRDKAYRLAEEDGFVKSAQDYWHMAESTKAVSP